MVFDDLSAIGPPSRCGAFGYHVPRLAGDALRMGPIVGDSRVCGGEHDRTEEKGSIQAQTDFRSSGHGRRTCGSNHRWLYLAVVDARCTLERAWGTNGGASSEPFPPSSRTQFAPGSNLRGIEIAFDVASGETVRARLVMRNTTAAGIGWNSSSVGFHFDVVDPVECEVVWFGPKSTDAALWGRGLKPGEERTHRMEWDGTNMHGERVSPGKYFGFARKGFGARTPTGTKWYRYTSPPIEFNLD